MRHLCFFTIIGFVVTPAITFAVPSASVPPPRTVLSETATTSIPSLMVTTIPIVTRTAASLNATSGIMTFSAQVTNRHTESIHYQAALRFHTVAEKSGGPSREVFTAFLGAPIDIGPNETFPMTITLLPPPFLRGAYDVYMVGGRLPHGEIEHTHYIGKFEFPHGPAVNLFSCTIEGKKTDGVIMLSPGLARVSCSAKYLDRGTRVLRLAAAVRMRPLASATTTGERYVTVSEKVSEVDMTIAVPETPGIYHGELGMFDERGTLLTPPVPFTLSVAGKQVMFHQVMKDRDAFTAGDTAHVSVSAFVRGVPNPSVSVTLLSGDKACSEAHALSYRPLLEFVVPIIEHCPTPVILAKILDGDGAVVHEERIVSAEVQRKESDERSHRLRFTIGLFIVVVLLFILSVAYKLHGGRGNTSSGLKLILLTICYFSLYPFSAHAGSITGRDVTLDVCYWDNAMGASSCGYATPYDFTLSLWTDKDSYLPGETMTIRAQLTGSAFGNQGAMGRIDGATMSFSIPSLALNASGIVLNGGIYTYNATAPATPGTYSASLGIAYINRVPPTGPPPFDYYYWSGEDRTTSYTLPPGGLVSGFGAVPLFTVASTGGTCEWYYEVCRSAPVETTTAGPFPDLASCNADRTQSPYPGLPIWRPCSACYNNGFCSPPPSPPTLSTPTHSAVTAVSATLGATLVSDGGSPITARGTCWGTSPNPTTNCASDGGTSLGAFAHSRTGLPSGTTIYYRGYADNANGRGYSPDGSFVTGSGLCTPTDSLYLWNGLNWDDYGSPMWSPPIPNPGPPDFYPKSHGGGIWQGMVRGQASRSYGVGNLLWCDPSYIPPPLVSCTPFSNSYSRNACNTYPGDGAIDDGIARLNAHKSANPSDAADVDAVIAVINTWRGGGTFFTNTQSGGIYANYSYDITDLVGCIRHTISVNVGKICTPNTPPTAIISSPSGGFSRVTNGTFVSFSGSGSDSDAGSSITAYEWRLGNPTTGTLLSTSPTFSWDTTSITPGSHTIYLRVRDNVGAWSTNNPSHSVVVGCLLLVTTDYWTGCVPSGGTLSSAYLANYPSCTNFSYCSPSSGGTLYTFDCIGTTSCPAGPSGVPPTMTQFSGEQNPVQGTNYVYTVNASDDMGQVRYEIDWDGNGMDAGDTYYPGSSSFVAAGSARNINRIWPTLGTYTARARACDQEGLCSSWMDLTPVTVSAQPAPIVTLYPGIAQGPDTLYKKFARWISGVKEVRAAGSQTIVFGVENGKLTWSTLNNPTSCVITSTWLGYSGGSGIKHVDPNGGVDILTGLPVGTWDFTITCTNVGGVDTDVATIIVRMPQCNNGIDDDSDGPRDYLGGAGDPSCANDLDDDEAGPPQCSDGIDNDGSGKMDYQSGAGDPSCANDLDNDETNPIIPAPTTVPPSPAAVPRDDPSAYSCGSANVGINPYKSCGAGPTLYNVGEPGSTYTVTSVVSSNSAEFWCTNCGSIPPITPTTPYPLTIAFRPAAAGTRSAQLTITLSTGAVFNVVVVGTGVNPFDPVTIDYGRIIAGSFGSTTEKTPPVLRMLNRGVDPIPAGTLDLPTDDTNPPNGSSRVFTCWNGTTWATSCPYPEIPPGGYLEMRLRFAPVRPEYFKTKPTLSSYDGEDITIEGWGATGRIRYFER